MAEVYRGFTVISGDSAGVGKLTLIIHYLHYILV